jgi:ATP-dependent RNA helicase DDX56/DBP9
LLNSKRLAEFFEERPRDLTLLRHDRPVAAASAAGASAPHLKHIPAYLRDPSLQGKSFVGSTPGAGGRLPAHKRRKVERVDPVKGFAPAPKRGADRLEQPTEIELRAEAAANKERKALKKRGGQLATEYVPKRNVRRNKGRKR